MFAAGAVLSATIAAIGFGALWCTAERRLRALRSVIGEVEQQRTQATAAADQALAAAAKWRHALDALPMPVWRRDADHRLVAYNQEYAEALGGDREGAVARGVLPREHHPVPNRGATPPGQSADGPPVTSRVVIRGQRRLLEAREVACPDGETIGYAVDRTDVDNAEHALRRHIAAHAAVLEILSAAVAIFGADQRLKFFNSAFARLWALEPGWLGSQPALGEILEYLHQSRRFPEYADFHAFKRERCAQFTALVEPRHELMHLPDGQTLQLTISPHPFGGLIYVFDNVTDRLALECSYNTLAQVQRATLDHLFEGIAVYGGDGRLKLHNPAFRAIWGLSETDVAGEPHIAAILEKARDLIDDGGNWPAKRAELIAQVTAQTFASGPLYRRDGSMLQVASVPLPDGEVLLTYLDISDTARIEQALRERNEALETAARLKSEFVANVSHELRTPLNTVIGFAEILHNQYFGSLNPSQREYSAGILDSAHQLLSLIDGIIDLASVEANYLELEPDRVDISSMLRALLLLTEDRAHNRGLQIDLHCPPRIGAIVADERRLKQALFNLISNAIKFTPPGGAIRVTAEQGDSELRVSVCDTATGFAADPADMIDHRDRAPAATCSSLGLSLVKSLIELHGGTVEIDSAPGRGTRVTCRLPVGGADAGSSKTSTANPPYDSRCEATA
ncbi:MAG TPA: PAS-domain containing protein [Stellaceae bacterium]|nr:PAS-domain containing protein [Stellaceae bacterium]